MTISNASTAAYILLGTVLSDAQLAAYLRSSPLPRIIHPVVCCAIEYNLRLEQ